MPKEEEEEHPRLEIEEDPVQGFSVDGTRTCIIS
jgi:hypothetical protein